MTVVQVVSILLSRNHSINTTERNLRLLTGFIMSNEFRQRRVVEETHTFSSTAINTSPARITQLADCLWLGPCKHNTRRSNTSPKEHLQQHLQQEQENWDRAKFNIYSLFDVASVSVQRESFERTAVSPCTIDHQWLTDWKSQHFSTQCERVLDRLPSAKSLYDPARSIPGFFAPPCQRICAQILSKGRRQANHTSFHRLTS